MRMKSLAPWLAAVSLAAVFAVVIGLPGADVAQLQSGNGATTTMPTLKATPAQVQGPYFLANSPWRTNLIPTGMKGQPITITGKVLATDGTELKNATIHVWLADPQGVYDNQDKDGNPLNIPVAKQTLRGRIKTDAKGYSFSILRPGNYEIEDGAMRPAHIHIKVEARGYNTLITQLYFTDDPWNEKDLPGPNFFQPELLVPLAAGANPGDPQLGTFNFVLAK
jgi:protocatechuate 3,4-dioxygenase beta subunit